MNNNSNRLNLINLDLEEGSASFTTRGSEFFSEASLLLVRATPVAPKSTELFIDVLSRQHTSKLRIEDWEVVKKTLVDETGSIRCQGTISVRFTVECTAEVKLPSSKEGIPQVTATFQPVNPEDIALFTASYPIVLKSKGMVVCQITFPVSLEIRENHSFYYDYSGISTR